MLFHEVRIGEIRRFGAYTFSREEIVEFASRYDPQIFHLDEGAARRGPWGGLIASGWHTAAACMRLLVDELVDERQGSLGSPGVDELRWLRPVRPGDTLSVETEVLDKRPSRRPDRGTVRMRLTARNQRDEEVLSMITIGILRRASV